MAYNLEGLSAYVEQNKEVILKNLFLGEKGIRNRMSIQTGVKGSMALHPFEVNPVLADGAECGFNAQGDAKITERTITAKPLKVNMEFCSKDLIGKYAEYLQTINATGREFPFEQFIVDGVIAGINKSIEKMIFLGDTASSDAVLKWTDGLLKIASADGAIATAISDGATAYEGIMKVYNAMTEDALQRGGEIIVSPAIYRAFVQDLVAKNYYHYDPANGEDGIRLPGSEVVVRKENGLAGSLKIIGTYAKNLYYGTDMEGGEESVDVWYSEDDRVWKIAVEWNSGVQIAFPSDVVIGTFASAPSPTI